MKPVTITAFPTNRSAGGLHDYFSQADYFWPNPQDPKGPYVNRDGQSNPDNFDDHRKVMIALSKQMPALTAAWMLTGESAVCGAGVRPPDGVVCERRDADEPESAIRAGSHRSFDGAVVWDYRYAASGGGGAGSVAGGAGGDESNERAAMIEWFAQYLELAVERAS